MARMTAGNPANGHENAPPSTLAAQIVQDIEGAGGHAKSSSSRAHVQELLKLILEDVDQSNGTQRNSPDAFEENRRLLIVIVKICLGTISDDDPFEDRAALQGEATQCLAVVELTVQKYPEAILQPPRGSSASTKPAGPLVLWLVPCLIQLYGRTASLDIQDAAYGALRACVDVQFKPTINKLGLHAVTRLLQGSVTDILTRLAAFDEFGDITASSTGGEVPSARTVVSVASNLEIKQGDSHHVSFVSAREDFAFLLGVLSALAEPIDETAAGGQRQTGTDLSWILESLSSAISHKMESVLVSLGDHSSTTLFDLLRTCIVQSTHTQDAVTCLSSVQLACKWLSSSLRVRRLKAGEAAETAGCRLIAAIMLSAHINKDVVQIYSEHLDPSVQAALTDPEHRQRLSPDIQRALGCVSKLGLEDQATLPGQLLDFDSMALRIEFERAIPRTGEAGADDTGESRPAKRLRSLDAVDTTSEHTLLLIERKIEDIFGVDAVIGTRKLYHAKENFSSLTQDNQCLLLSALADAFCTNASRLPSLQACHSCRDNTRVEVQPSQESSELFEELYTTIEEFTKQLQEQRNARPRVAALLAVNRALAHSRSARHFDLQSSTLGQICLQSLKSTIRDVRIAALSAIERYFTADADTAVLRRNRLICLDMWRSLSERNELIVQETCIFGLGLLSRSAPEEDEMNMILLGLLEYLGHANAFISSMAYEELSKLAAFENRSLWQVLEPYWRTLAVSMVKSLNSRPQVAQSICDLLYTSVPELLKRTQFFTIPYLVFKRQQDVLQRIAQANGPDATVHSLCFQHGQLAAILCFLLLQPSEDSDSLVVESMATACGGFDSLTLPDLLKCDTMYMAYELLKAAGEQDGGTRSRALQLLQALADLSHGRTRVSRSSQSKGRDSLGLFFETWALAIVQLLSETITNTKSQQPLFERRRCIGALGEMAALAQTRLGNALPQIRSCLQFAVQDPKLRDDAFDAWLKLLETLDRGHVATLLDQTFALLVHYWDSLSDASQIRAQKALSYVFNTHGELVRNEVQTLPSLSGITLLRKLETELAKFRNGMDTRRCFAAFAKRCQSETATVVSVALKELEPYLAANLLEIQSLVMSEQPDMAVGMLARSVLDACVRFKEQSTEVSARCARCLGLLGCLDPFRVDVPREKKEIFVLWNFDDRSETVDFVLFFLEETLVKVYLATTVTNRQQILAFGMQELLRVCDMDATVKCLRGAADEEYRRWIDIDETTRNILTPFLTSKYVINAPALLQSKAYPIHSATMRYARWIHDLVLDMLQRGRGDNASLVFNICRRLVRNQDTSIANFLLPYVILNVVVEGSEEDFEAVATELFTILSTPLSDMTASSKQNIIQCSQSVFSVVDYLSRWIQEKRRSLANPRSRVASKEQQQAVSQIKRIEGLLGKIPADIMSRRAADCHSFSRALFYWEQHIRKQRSSVGNTEMQSLYKRLQEIYMQIDEPDGIEGLSSCLQSEVIEQQVLEDQNAGRWSAVQSWYELQLAHDPEDVEAQLNLARALRESGQHDVMLNLISDIRGQPYLPTQLGSYAVEASWMTGRWDKLTEYLHTLAEALPGNEETFNIGIANALQALIQDDTSAFDIVVEKLFLESARPLTMTSTTTLQGCHTSILQFHVLFELEMITGRYKTAHNKPDLVTILDNRLQMLGTFPSDQKYILGIRRAAMELVSRGSDTWEPKLFSSSDISATLLKTAKLARKGGYTQHALSSVLRALYGGNPSARIEYARLMWSEGHHRRAIRTLEDAIALNAFESADVMAADGSATVTHTVASRQNPLSARAHLLLAKWIDRAGQTASKGTVERYRTATMLYPKWEKSYYLLGKHYNKLLESEKSNPPEKQAQTYITGEMAKLVIENFVRSLSGGTKYIYQTLPKLLTLWLDLGAEVEKSLDPKHGDQSFRDHAHAQRRKIFGALMKTVEKYANVRLPAYAFYTAFSQIVARITHPNKEVYQLLVEIIVKVVLEHPAQAMWPLLAMMKSKASGERARRGLYCRTKLLERAKSLGSDRNTIQEMLVTGQKLTDQLVDLCDKPVNQQLKNPVSLKDNFGFAHRKATPCKLVIPVESTLLAKLPPAANGIKNWKAFAKETVVTIEQFLDEATVLSSLAKPRRVKIRGSNGQVYSLLCKPKDDLRKDQRLLEFNSMISRILKRDAECSKRRLYIKTYAVTPLNEECGLIEWVDGMRTLRDILLNGYRQQGISIDYEAIRAQLNSVAANPDRVDVFTRDVLGRFPPLLHDWFVDQFREPDAWFGARLRYTRSAAVMSMVGHVLGLGDRHGENILLEEAAGGTFHVDFNCLFDKGKTFETPERVPFRLTHNMVDAFGAYRENGPFRRSCELAMGILRQNEDTLMTILETFLYDPTQDFIGKRRQKPHSEVPATPQGVLESVRNKVRGLLPMESVPLSVEGYVQLQIQEATDAYNLARMYIGWSPFL